MSHHEWLLEVKSATGNALMNMLVWGQKIGHYCFHCNLENLQMNFVDGKTEEKRTGATLTSIGKD